MKKSTRALLGVGIWLVIYFFAVYLVSSIGFIHGFVEMHDWLSNGEISQLTFLIVSVVLIFVLAKGNLATYGLRWVRIGQLIKPVVMAVAVCFLFFVLSGIVMTVSGPPSAEGDNPITSKSLLNFILTVVLLASICEEIFNRGLIQGFLSPLKDKGIKLGKVHISLPVIICGLLFGLGHLCLLGNMDSRIVVLIVISATALGFVAGYFREKTDSLVPAIAVHMTFNIVSGVIPRLLMRLATG